MSLNRNVESCFLKHQQNIDETLQESLKVIKREDRTCHIGYGNFDQNILWILIETMVIMHKLPLRFV